jgi:aldose 1-epimerase
VAAVREPFGRLPDGTEIELVVLGNGGLELSVASFGATVQSLVVDGVDVVLGYASLDEYVAGNPAYFGGIVGRYANRIRDAAFFLEGRRYVLEPNEWPHSLHGGSAGLDRRAWQVLDVSEGAVVLACLSPDGEMGFPGALSVVATYSLADRELRLDLEATTDADTVVNLASHIYWNLAGSGTVDGHLLRVPAGRYVAVDVQLIPTGELLSVAGTRLDLRRPSPIGDNVDGFDVTYVLDEPGSTAPAAELVEPTSGRRLTVLTTEPGLHVFSAEGLPRVGPGKSGRPYPPRGGLALEAQHFPDSPNRPEFPSTVLRPGQTFRSTTVWQLGG